MLPRGELFKTEDMRNSSRLFLRASSLSAAKGRVGVELLAGAALLGSEVPMRRAVEEGERCSASAAFTPPNECVLPRPFSLSPRAARILKALSSVPAWPYLSVQLLRIQQSTSVPHRYDLPLSIVKTVPKLCRILSPIALSTASSKCRFGSCLPTWRVFRCCGVNVASSLTDAV